MARKIHFAFVTVFILFLAFIWQIEGLAIEKREAPQQKSAGQTVDEVLAQIQNGWNDFSKNIQNNELIQNITATLKNVGEVVSSKTQEVVSDLQKKN